MTLKQPLRNGNQTTSHAGYVKYILETFLKLLIWGQQEMPGGVRDFLPVLLVEGISMSGQLVFLN